MVRTGVFVSERGILVTRNCSSRHPYPTVGDMVAYLQENGKAIEAVKASSFEHLQQVCYDTQQANGNPVKILGLVCSPPLDMKCVVVGAL